MDWVHCNACHYQPSKGKSFCLTNCGHIFCTVCLNKAQKQCTVCNAPCSTIPLTAQMKPDVQQYFSDPIESFRKQQKTLLQVLEFQKKHRDRFINHLKESETRNQQLMERVSHLEKENLALRTELLRISKGGGVSGPMTAVSATPSPVCAASAGTTLRTRGEPYMVNHPTAPSPSPTSMAQMNARIGPTPSPAHMVAQTPTGSHPPNTPMTGSRSVPRQQLAQNIPHQTPSGPKRIVVRTPPVDGKMGFIPPSRTAMLPGGARPPGHVLSTSMSSIHSAGGSPSPHHSQSPMCLSPAATRQDWASPSPRGQPRSVAPGTAPHFSFSQVSTPVTRGHVLPTGHMTGLPVPSQTTPASQFGRPGATRTALM